jgi:hypothetical protein
MNKSKITCSIGLYRLNSTLFRRHYLFFWLTFYCLFGPISIWIYAFLESDPKHNEGKNHNRQGLNNYYDDPVNISKVEEVKKLLKICGGPVFKVKSLIVSFLICVMHVFTYYDIKDARGNVNTEC